MEKTITTQETKWNYIEDEKITLKVIAKDVSGFLSVFIPAMAVGAVFGLIAKYIIHAMHLFVFPPQENFWSIVVGILVMLVIIQTVVFKTKSMEI